MVLFENEVAKCSYYSTIYTHVLIAYKAQDLTSTMQCLRFSAWPIVLVARWSQVNSIIDKPDSNRETSSRN